MGEAEGKKDEADYKRLQTFPLVRVSPGEEAGQPQSPHSLGERRSSLSSAERTWEEVQKDFTGSDLEI